IKLRQLTDGRHLVQVIYTPDGVIQDCEYLADSKTTRNFLKTLRKELKLALEEQTYKILEKNDNEDERFYRHFGNVTLRLLKDNEKLPPDIANWLNYDRLKMECLERHEELTYMMSNKNKIGEEVLTRRSFRENFIMPGTKWCGAGQLAERYNELGDDSNEDMCCRAHDNCRANIGAFRKRFAYFNYRPYTISHCRCDRRKKRDAMELLRVPGTKWCGKGFSATHYSQLGGYTRTDRCCRVHDLRCPFWIGGMEKKYGLYNWRVNTLMHCRCDERFVQIKKNANCN
ncbi:Phospholipase A2 isozyme PA4, partial [Papilio machaon]